MVPFLKQVSSHYYEQGGIDRKCFVFPNRRSMVFFRKYLGESVASAGEPLLCPRMFTMNDLFYRISGKSPAPREQLILKLFECYRKLDKREEELDEFIFWGGVILSDFNDVDKYLVDADRLFSNVSDFKSMQKPEEYLNPAQLKALDRFLGHFNTSGSYKAEFLRIWEILRPLYRDFNDALAAEGMAYEGQVYRSLAESLREASVKDVLPPLFSGTDKFVFVGLNALNECEKYLLSKLRNAVMAEFCWDYSSDMIRDGHNKSSFFMSKNVSDYPQAFRIDPEGLGKPEINVISVPSSIGQVKQIPAVFERIGGRIDMNTAVVLPDEGLLLPVLNTIPEDIREINVTMGYPMNGSELWSLMNELSTLQMHLKYRDDKVFFHHKQVWALFSNSIFRNVISERGKETVEKVKTSAKYYIPQEDLKGDPVLELLFRPVIKDPASRDPETIAALEQYGCEVLQGIAPALLDKNDMSVELDFAREYFLAIQRLRTCKLDIRPATYFRMLSHLVGNASVPFKGEPLKGLQIMGPLETRALDFENLILLNCNEGMFPRRSVSPSFIPPELRRGFDLPTYEYQDAVWAYYFYRMIQRSRRVWLMFDSRTEGLRYGEQSRYISQLELHFGIKLNRYVVSSPVSGRTEEPDIEKTAEDLEKIWEKPVSVSAVKTYLRCPAKFYYQKVCGLKENEEVAESLDSRTIGNVYHKTMQHFYTVPEGIVTKSYLMSLLSDKCGQIRDRVRQIIMEELHSLEVAGRNIIYEDVICSYVRKTMQRDIELMEYRGVGNFKVFGLEIGRYTEIGGHSFKGYIDRLDSFAPGEIRVVDYKTGKADPDEVDLQLYLYDEMIKHDPLGRGRQIVNSTYQLSRLFVDGVKEEVMTEERREEMRGVFESVLSELDDLSVPFKRTDDREHTCIYCSFKSICGR